MEDFDRKLELLFSGELDSTEASSFLEEIKGDEALHKGYLAYKASHAAFEYEIANDTRDFVGQLLEEDIRNEKQKPSTKILYIAGIAASFLILVLSIFSVNLSHNDIAIADKYNINSIAARNSGGFQDTNFSEAVQAYFGNDFDKAREKLLQPSEEDAIVNDYKDWLSLMLDLKDKGSKSQEFHSKLDEILGNENHEFYFQALKLKNEFNRFWQKFVVRI